jgi:hypothetical protein
VETLLSSLVYLVGLAAVLGALVWLGIRVRRRGVGGEVMDHVDQLFRPTAPQFRHEIQTQEERMLPGSSADAPPVQDPRHR